MRIDLEGRTKVEFFADLYEKAKAASEAVYEKMDRNYRQYKGSREIDAVEGGFAEDASHVRNATYEMVESQVTGYIPNPSVRPKMWSEQNEVNAKSVEILLKNKRDELDYEKMNDIDERYTPIYGGSVWHTDWDESILTHSTVGDVKLICLSPRHFCGQPNIFDVQDMEYCFITFETTKEDIVRRYGVSVSVAEDAESDEAETDETATLVCCFYKDEEDKVCKYVFSGDTELCDIDDYYARKRRVCTVCGKREELCECEHPEIEVQNEEYEELEADIVCQNGRVIPAMTPVFENGMPVYETVQRPMEIPGIGIATAVDENTGMALPIMEDVQVPKMEKTRLPFYKPKKLPVVIRKNTSEEDSLYGQSDCEFIRPQQQAINKLESKILEASMRSGVFVKVPEDWVDEPDDSMYGKVYRVSHENKDLFGVIDTQINLLPYEQQAERHYDHAKRMLGISDTFQGQYDASAQSGKAKQIQVQQANGRLDSKRRMKNAAHAEIDRIIFEYYLAYADEPRPAAYKDTEGRTQNAMFSRYDFIEYDDAGGWYYNDEYLFSADASADVERNRELMWEENRKNFQTGAYGPIEDAVSRLVFWQVMEKLHYPNATEAVSRMREQVEAQKQMQELQAQVGSLQGEVADRAEYEKWLMSKMGGTGNG